MASSTPKKKVVVVPGKKTPEMKRKNKELEMKKKEELKKKEEIKEQQRLEKSVSYVLVCFIHDFNQKICVCYLFVILLFCSFQLS